MVVTDLTLKNETSIFEIKAMNERLDTFMKKDIVELQQRSEYVMRQSSKQTDWYLDLEKKMKQTIASIKPFFDKVELLEDYCQQSVPLLTQLQISDALQEFLCLPD